MLEGARAIVTGGAGFIGSHLAERLAARNDIVALDLQPAAKASNLVPVRDRIAYAEADIRSPKDLDRVFRDVDVVFHLAALVSVPQSFEEPEAFASTNTHGTLAVLRAAKAAGANRVVYASSCAVYGARPPPLREDSALDLRSPYTVTKAAGEMWCRLYHDLGLETVALRLFNVYGPRQPAGGSYAAVIPNFLRAVARGERPEIFGDGEQTRDFVYVADVAEAFDRAATASGVSGEVFNVGSGEPVSVNRLLAVINDVFRTRVEARHRDARPGDIRASFADVRKAESRLGFRPRVSLAQGLLATAGVGVGDR